MKVQFDKMQGLGNDFVVINTLSRSFIPTQAVIQQLANRHFGIGCDQVLLIKKPKHPDADFYFQIFNHDGSEALQCGNGARCIAKYIYEKKLSDKKKLLLETQSGIISTEIENNDVVTVVMGNPTFEFILSEGREAVFVELGNPHIIIFLNDDEKIEYKTLGEKISKQYDANIGFAKISGKNVKLYTFERGAGMTLACGSNACAAAVAGIVLNKLVNEVYVDMEGGSLQIAWTGSVKDPVIMKGPAVTVFSGEIFIGRNDL